MTLYLLLFYGNKVLKHGSVTAYCRIVFFMCTKFFLVGTSFLSPPLSFHFCMQSPRTFAAVHNAWWLYCCPACCYCTLNLQFSQAFFILNFPFHANFLSSKRRHSAGVLWVCWGLFGSGVHLLPLLNSIGVFLSLKNLRAYEIVLLAVELSEQFRGLLLQA